MKKIDVDYSVLMSIYKNEKPAFFEKSIESMLQQTYKPNEIVIVQDGELTYELKVLLESYKKNYPNLFTIVELKKNLGLGKALDIGLKYCKNELVARMDTDDISLKNRCELQIKEFLKDNKLSIVGTMIDEFYENPDNVVASRIVPCEYQEIIKFSRKRNPFNHPTVMYKKTAVFNSGGYGENRRNQDLDLFVRMLINGCIAKNINKSLLLFRANKDNLNRRKSWEKCKSYIQLIYKFWRKGHSRFLDLVIVTISQLIIYFSPLWVLKWISIIFLRKDLK